MVRSFQFLGIVATTICLQVASVCYATPTARASWPIVINPCTLSQAAPPPTSERHNLATSHTGIDVGVPIDHPVDSFLDHLDFGLMKWMGRVVPDGPIVNVTGRTFAAIELALKALHPGFTWETAPPTPPELILTISYSNSHIIHPPKFRNITEPKVPYRPTNLNFLAALPDII